MMEGEKSTPLGFGWWRASVVCELRRFVHQKSKNPGGEGVADSFSIKKDGCVAETSCVGGQFQALHGDL